MTAADEAQGAPGLAPEDRATIGQVRTRTSKEGPSREASVRQKRRQARGNYPGDWDRESVLLTSFGHDKGGRIYLSAETLRVAFAAASMDPPPRVDEVEVWRTVLGGHKGEAQVLLKIRLRRAVP